MFLVLNNLAFLCLELQQWCGTIPGHLPDSPHHAGHSVERHSGREFFICLPLWHFSGSIIQYNSGCLFFPLLFTGWPHKLWETQTGKCRLLVVSWINYWQISICCSFCSIFWPLLYFVVSFIGIWDSLSDSAASSFLFPLQFSSQPSCRRLAADAHAAHRPGEVRLTLNPFIYIMK